MARAGGPDLERKAETMQRNMDDMLREVRRRELSEEPQQRRHQMGLPRGRQTLSPRDKMPCEPTQCTRLPFARRRMVGTQLSF